VCVCVCVCVCVWCDYSQLMNVVQFLTAHFHTALYDLYVTDSAVFAPACMSHVMLTRRLVTRQW